MSALTRPAPVWPPVTTSRTVAEDLLLLLFQPASGTIAGEATLYYVLAGAVLAELGLEGRVRTIAATTVEAVLARPPADPLLRPTWDYVAWKPREVQTVLPTTGPSLRGLLLDRLVERGDIRRRTRKRLGVFRSTLLAEGDTGRRATILREVRAVLVDDAQATPRTAALVALLYGSGVLSQLDREIPWTSATITRAEALTAGSWGASAAAKAVTRTVTATIVNHVAVAAARQRG